LETNIVSIKFSQAPGAYEYSYYTAERLSVGDRLLVPAGHDFKIGWVAAIDIPESRVVGFKDRLKVIPPGSRREPFTARPKEEPKPQAPPPSQGALFTQAEPMGNLTPEILRRAIDALGPIEQDPIIAVKINPYDFEEVKARCTFDKPGPNTTGIPPIIDGITVYLDPEIPRGKCKPIRKSEGIL
jgi:hypothetical protein